jgi:hypothetical protein
VRVKQRLLLNNEEDETVEDEEAEYNVHETVNSPKVKFTLFWNGMCFFILICYFVLVVSFPEAWKIKLVNFLTSHG